MYLGHPWVNELVNVQNFLCLHVQNLEHIRVSNTGGETNEISKMFTWEGVLLFLEEHQLSVWHLHHDTDAQCLSHEFLH